MSSTAIDIVIDPRVTDLGDFEVRRVLPFAKRREVGPFIFFDHIGLQGPVTFRFRHLDQPLQQGEPDALTMCVSRYIDADLSDAGSASYIRDRRQRRSAGDRTIRRPGHQPAGL